MSNAIVISFEPDSALLRGCLHEELFIYYCNDDQEAKGNWWNRPKDVLARERELLRKSDMVLCLTEGFASTRRPYCAEMHVVPNGVDQDFIAKSGAVHTRPSDMMQVEGTVVGFFGVVDKRLDVELLLHVARNRPEWSLVLVGPMLEPMETEFRTLCALPNVHYLGGKPKETFPAYLNAMDVGLIPSIVFPKTRNVLSLKLFEYTALGKPIVASDLPELRRYSEFVKTSSNKAEFLENIELWLAGWNAEKRETAIRFASANTWRHRAESISELIDRKRAGSAASSG